MAAIDRLKKYTFYLTEPGADGSVSQEQKIPVGKALNIRQITARLYSMQNLPSTAFDIAFEIYQRLISGVNPADFSASEIKMFRISQWVGGGATVSQAVVDTEMVWTPPVGFTIGGNFLVADLYSTATGVQLQGEVNVYGNLVAMSPADELLFNSFLRT